MSTTTTRKRAVKRRRSAMVVAPKPTEVQPIILLPHQIAHYERLSECFRNPHHSVMLDTSETGAGKTFTAGKIAQDLNLPHILIICPTSAIATWKPFLQTFGFPPEKTKLMSFAEVRSSKSTLVYREKRLNAQQERGLRFTYYVTREYLQMVQEGLFLIVDEMQHLKNHSLQSQCIVSLVAPITPQSSSKSLFLSATPFDKAEHIFQVTRLLGIVQQEKLYHIHPFTSTLVLDGYLDMLHKARLFSAEETDAFQHLYPTISRTSIYTIFSYAVTNIILPHISSSMKKPPIVHQIVTRNGFFNLPPSQINNIVTALNNLRQVAQERAANQLTGTPEENRLRASRLLAVQAEAIKLLEYSKREIFLRLVQNTFRDSPTAKVLVFVSYHTTLQWLADALSEYKPIVFSGKLSKTERDTAIHKIQAPDLKHRLFLGITQVSGESISLHDIHGGFPRFLFISPSYSLTHVYQSIGRINRVGVKSDATATVVFVKGAENDQFALFAELRLRMLLDSKARYLRKVLHEEVRQTSILPDKFPVFVEPQ